MNSIRKTTLLLYFPLLFSFLGYAQQLPPIVKYPSSVYSAGNQNWMISQDKNQFIPNYAVEISRDKSIG